MNSVRKNPGQIVLSRWAQSRWLNGLCTHLSPYNYRYAPADYPEDFSQKS